MDLSLQPSGHGRPGHLRGIAGCCDAAKPACAGTQAELSGCAWVVRDRITVTTSAEGRDDHQAAANSGLFTPSHWKSAPLMGGPTDRPIQLPDW